MPVGYSGTPLVKKLGIKPGFRMLLRYPPDHYFDLIERFPDEVAVYDEIQDDPMDFIHLFVKEKEILEKEMPLLKSKIKKDGMIWVSWPKGKSKIPTDLKDNIIRKAGLDSGLVDIKVCAVDKDWSGLKFVYRIKDR